MRNPDPATPEGDITLQFKVPATLDQRLLALRARLAERAGVPAAKLPKAEVARQALDRGLRAMEADLALPEGESAGAGVHGRVAASGWMTAEPRGPLPAALATPAVARVVQSRAVAIEEPPGAYPDPLVRYINERGVAKAILRKGLLEHNGIVDTGQSEAELEPLARVYPRTPRSPERTPEHSCPACGVHHDTCPECGTTHGDTHSQGCPWRGVMLRYMGNGSVLIGTSKTAQR